MTPKRTTAYRRVCSSIETISCLSCSRVSLTLTSCLDRRRRHTLNTRVLSLFVSRSSRKWTALCRHRRRPRNFPTSKRRRITSTVSGIPRNHSAHNLSDASEAPDGARVRYVTRTGCVTNRLNDRGKLSRRSTRARRRRRAFSSVTRRLKSSRALDECTRHWPRVCF